MNHVKTVPHENVSANDQTGGREVAIFHKIAKRRSEFQETQASPIKVCSRSLLKKFQLWYTINLNTVYDLGYRLAFFSKSDYRHVIAGLREQSRLVLDTGILRKMILNHHQDSGRVCFHNPMAGPARMLPTNAFVIRLAIYQFRIQPNEIDYHSRIPMFGNRVVNSAIV